MNAASLLGLWLLSQISLADALLGDTLLASINQCRALHAELAVLKLSDLRSVTRGERPGLSSWQLLDASGQVVAGVERKAVPIESSSNISEPGRLSPPARAMAEWSAADRLEPRLSDRRGNTFAWASRRNGVLSCMFYRPEYDQLERVWVNLQALTR